MPTLECTCGVPALLALSDCSLVPDHLPSCVLRRVPDALTAEEETRLLGSHRDSAFPSIVLPTTAEASAPNYRPSILASSYCLHSCRGYLPPPWWPRKSLTGLLSSRSPMAGQRLIVRHLSIEAARALWPYTKFIAWPRGATSTNTISICIVSCVYSSAGIISAPPAGLGQLRIHLHLCASHARESASNYTR